MSGFRKTNVKGVQLYTGDPSCDAAHAALLEGLKKLGTPFLGVGDTISLSQQGNLGEYISLHVARSGPLSATEKFAPTLLHNS